MVIKTLWSLACLAGAAAVLSGCVADTPLSVAPGAGKTTADLQRDDAACRVAAPAPTPAPATAPTTAPAPAANYFQCMASKGELVVANRTVAYPVYPAYAPYPYYPYGYPYYGYPYSAAYLAPYVGLGVGIGFGGGFYHDHGWYGGGRGFHGGGFHH